MTKILTYIASTPQSIPVLAAFTDSIVALLREQDCNEFGATVTCALRDNCFLLSPRSGGFFLARAAFCPIYHLTAENISQLPEETRSRGVDVAVSTLLESADNHVLLTKRSHHMRTFPNVWVPPGGHIELGESLEDAGIRELTEETGISIKTAAGYPKSKILCLWESTFPPRLTHGGLPKRHHIVVYCIAKDQRRAEEINKTVTLQMDEVDKCAWICPHLASKIVATDPQFNLKVPKGGEACHDINCLLKYQSLQDARMLGSFLHNNVATTVTELPVFPLLNSYSNDIDLNIERVSTGTKFALKLWLNGR